MSHSQQSHLRQITAQKLSQLHQAYSTTQDKYKEYQDAQQGIIAQKKTPQKPSQNQKNYVYISNANIFLNVDSSLASNLLSKCLTDLDTEKKRIQDEIMSVSLEMRRIEGNA